MNEPSTGVYRPEPESQSVTTQWDGTTPEVSGGAESLLDGFDPGLDLGPKPEQRSGVRATIPAPSPDDSVLARLPEREAPWVRFADRTDNTEQLKSMQVLAKSMKKLDLYSRLPEEEIERRAEYYFDLWMSQPQDVRRKKRMSLKDSEMVWALSEPIPQSWLIRREAALNARLRLLENPIFRNLPDTVDELALNSEGVLEKFVREGPGRHIVRAAMAMVSNYVVTEDLADQVLSREGLARILVVHSRLNPIEKVAFRLSRLLDFANMTRGQLELLAKRYLETWDDLPARVQKRIVYDDVVGRGEAQYLEVTDFKRASELGMDVPKNPFPVMGPMGVAYTSDPPDSWLHWQRLESSAWDAAKVQAGESLKHDFDARSVHKQLFTPDNTRFVSLLPADRYRLSKFIALGLKEAQKDPQFLTQYVNEDGYVSPEGIEIVMKKGGIRESGLDGRIKRSNGLRINRQKLKDADAPHEFDSVFSWHMK